MELKKYQEVDGDLIKLALAGEFDVVAQGCNAFCTMGAGISVPMKEAFGTDKFPMELIGRGDYNKLGQINYEPFVLDDGKAYPFDNVRDDVVKPDLYVVNCYTQYNYGRNHADGDIMPLDFAALTLCLTKINHIFKGKHIGLPVIGGGLGGGNPLLIKKIFQELLKDCFVTVVNYKP